MYHFNFSIWTGLDFGKGGILCWNRWLLKIYDQLILIFTVCLHLKIYMQENKSSHKISTDSGWISVLLRGNENNNKSSHNHTWFIILCEKRKKNLHCAYNTTVKGHNHRSLSLIHAHNRQTSSNMYRHSHKHTHTCTTYTHTHKLTDTHKPHTHTHTYTQTHTLKHSETLQLITPTSPTQHLTMSFSHTLHLSL